MAKRNAIYFKLPPQLDDIIGFFSYEAKLTKQSIAEQAFYDFFSSMKAFSKLSQAKQVELAEKIGAYEKGIK